MGYRYTKLFEQILESTIWCEPDSVRVVWITMLAMGDKDGNVYASIPGLAKRANVPMPEAQKALDCFLAPDPYSRTVEFEGRRIEPIDGGWKLLNHAKYRNLLSDEAEKERKRIWWQQHRSRAASETSANRTDLAQADTEAKATTEEVKASPASKRVPKGWYASSEGIVQAGKALGLKAKPGESEASYKTRIEAKLGS